MFDAEVGLMEGPVLHLSLDELATPVKVSARRVPVSMKEPLRQEMTRLEVGNNR